MRGLWLVLIATLSLTLGVMTPGRAQETSADTAAVLLKVARGLEAEGRSDLAENLLRLITERYPHTPAAQEAARRFATMRGERTAQSGRTELIVWNTVYGAWLGLAIPAALGADEPEPYGLGLLLGGPLGFFASRAYGRSTSMSSGQARVINFGFRWGSWQAFGWREVLEIGTETICEPFGCYESTPDEAPFAAMVVGGLTGLGIGVALARTHDIAAGSASLINHAALWGTWYGLATAALLEAEDDAALAMTLIGGNVAMLAAIPAARVWKPTTGRVRLVSVAGFAGLVAGLGLDLLFEVDDDQVVFLLPTITSTLALIAGARITREDRSVRDRDNSGLQTGLLQFDRGISLGVPTLIPTAVPVVDPSGRTHWRPGIEVRLLTAGF